MITRMRNSQQKEEEEMEEEEEEEDEVRKSIFLGYCSVLFVFVLL